ncbi:MULTISPECIES: hypothetical protein [Bacillus]|uniref:hypothetical protein n=1 Tax=Bacillus TaxID=1386 RepID=UPI000BF9580B|nr:MULTISPECIES: hypothetical protein [Bacillus cereus group]NIE92130.1 hypothetical protein [Bacillus sp. Ab-1751]MBJ7963039.1 hypothetical protein [Bacillus cereus]MBJ7998430.1 hypothetical protein [Bacillus cereus]PFF61834.1 hypothetical protein CN358_16960 [Bacillus thuringiensis]PFJ10450.1 hypothetical protein COI87_17830 [Bacillus thuringiensis]
MSTIYFAKFNINEKIYEVYDEKENLDELLTKVFLGMKTDVELGEVRRKKNVNFKFITLNKDPDKFTVNGRLVAYAPGVHVSYDEEKDDVVETKDNKKAAYVTFYFDVRRETIGFVPKNDFGRKMFIDRFKKLIEELVPDVGEVEIVLEKDRQILDEKLRLINHVDEISINLIPPNNDKKLFEALFGINSDDLTDTGGSKYTFNIKGTTKKGLNLGSTFIKNLVNGVIVGYGNLIARGKNTSGEPVNVNSEDEALFTKGITDINKDNIPEISEKSERGIVNLAVMKATAKDDLIQRQQELKLELLREIENERTKAE